MIARVNKKIVLSLAVATLFGTMLLAQPGGMMKCPMNDKPGAKGMMSPNALFMELNLSDAQKEKFQALQAEAQKIRPEMQKSRKNNMSMSKYVSEKSFDKQKFIDDQIKDMSARIALRAENFEKRYNILNDEQKIEFSKMLKEREERMANRMKNMDYMLKKQKK
ncbi:MAG: Spy/CpxP family protein refolding chaperone [Campylobacterales bacterium]|nr:Spy/CpxP family protein refolding chaperone [Campylobacterales bacterium]